MLINFVIVPKNIRLGHAHHPRPIGIATYRPHPATGPRDDVWNTSNTAGGS